MRLVTLFLCLSLQPLVAWERIYLATYPRSGNHWARYLIEEATHIATSSVYCDPDPPHIPTSFPWGGFCCDHGYEGESRYPTEDEAVVIKTHYPTFDALNPFDRQPSIKTIRIVRHPIDSLYSFYLYIYGDSPPSPSIPQNTLKRLVAKWKKFQKHWDREQNTITFYYEDLYNNPKAVLEQLISAIGYQISQEDIERAITRYPPRGGIAKHLIHFNDRDLQFVYDKLEKLMKRHGYKKLFPTTSSIDSNFGVGG